MPSGMDGNELDINTLNAPMDITGNSQQLQNETSSDYYTNENLDFGQNQQSISNQPSSLQNYKNYAECDLLFNNYCGFVVNKIQENLSQYQDSNSNIFQKVALGIVFIVIFLTGVIGNSLVFGVLIKAIQQCKYKPQLQTRRGGLILLLCTVYYLITNVEREI